MTPGQSVHRGRRVRFSLFARCALLVALSTAVVTLVLTVQAFRLLSDTAMSGVTARAEGVTRSVARQAGGAIRFGKDDVLRTDLQREIDGSDGTAIGGIAINLQGEVLAEILSGDPEIDGQLALIAQRAVSSGEPARSADGLLVAYPAQFGPDHVVTGAVGLSWSANVILAEADAAETRAIALAGGVFMLVVIGGAVILRQTVSLPIRGVGRTMKAVVAGGYEGEIPHCDRRDEIGLIARDLEYFRTMMAAASRATNDAIFQSAGFRSSSAAMVMTDPGFRITLANKAFVDLARRNLEKFRAISPGFDPDNLVGTDIEVFHASSAASRETLHDPDSLPVTADIRLGSRIMKLGISIVRDKQGKHVGYVVEWADVTGIRRDAAVLSALEKMQIMIELDEDWRFLRGNAQFRETCGDCYEALSGRAFEELVRPVTGALAGLRARLERGEAAMGRFELLVDDSPALLDGSICPVLDAAGSTAGYVLLGLDITEQERQIRDAEAARQRMVAAQEQVVGALQTGLARLAEGDLTYVISEKFDADHERLRHDFNAALDSLNEAIVNVLDTTLAMRGEVSEITSAADDLSRRTEHQAATLEQTAAALAEITAAVNSAAAGAQNASKVVFEARANAENSGQVVRDAVAAMGEISASSDQISKIIGVIDDIAFQTNLLALNAGVEAARAGDAGRGFAVVASEVRALAQRSSDAAREIGGLITASGRHVRRGVELVGEAGEALARIANSVTDISDHVTEIVASAQEQSAGLNEVNSSMGQLDHVTQQNAAMFEETTAASHALARQTETLTSRMSRFRIRTEPVAAQAGTTRLETAPVPVGMPGRAAHTLPKARIRGALALDGTDPDDWEDF